MNVFLNGEVREIPEGLNIEGLLGHFSLPSQRIAIELNKQVIRRQNWEQVKISESDKIEVIHFVGGG